MTAAELIPSLLEKKRPAPNWTDTKGVYADLSNYPDAEYYCKCPRCGNIHGSYKNMREAHGKRLCDRCNVEAINKTKKMVKEVDAPKNRGKPGKGLSRVFNEADELLPAPGEAKPEDKFNAREYLMTTPAYGGWIGAAIKELSENTGLDFRLAEHQDCDLDYPDEAACFTAVADGTDDYGYDHEFKYKVWKSEDEASTEARNNVVSQLSDEPDNFNQDWLKHYVPIERLRDYLNDSATDVEWLTDMSFQEQVDYLINHGHFLDEDDFYTPNGKFRKITRRTQTLFDAGLEAFQEKQKVDFDPVDYMEGIYGKKDALAEIIKAVGIDVEAAADNAIATDGWDHFADGYGEGHDDLTGGAVAVRMH